jgi:large subunit ribosomal protein L24
MAWKLKTGDEVYVIAGDDKGAKGTITKVDRSASRVYVGGVNMTSRHVKPSVKNPEGGVVRKEAPIHISNVALVAPNSGESLIWSKKLATRVGFRVVGSVKHRFAKRDGVNLNPV